MKYSLVFLIALFNFGLGQNDIDWKNVKHLNYVHPFVKSKLTNNEFRQLEGRIISGEEVLPHQYPHQAALFLQIGQQVAFCGGSLISKRYVLTAAHCAFGVTNHTVILGAHNIKAVESSTQTFYSSEKIVHPKWIISQLLARNDIALIKLPRDAELNEFVQPIRLPSFAQSETTFADTEGTAIGWGKTSDASQEVSPVLRQVSSQVTSPESCKKYYSGQVPISNKSHVCFSPESNRGACNGDSGGPLLVTDKDNKVTQIGIASFVSNYGCESSYPTVYTRKEIDYGTNGQSKFWNDKNDISRKLHPRIVNGHETIPHQYPFQAAVLSQLEDDVNFCGGTLISKRYVLTAAHCVYQFDNFTVILGAHNVSWTEPSQQVFHTDEVVIHPRWFATFLISRNDIALVKLPRDAELNEYVQLIRLPRLDQMETTFDGLNATTIGWGLLSEASKEHSQVLRHTFNSIVPYEICKEQYANFIPINKRSHLCLSHDDGRGVCNNDSGGPLIITDEDKNITQIGITSFMTGCEGVKEPMGFVRITSYLYFIAENSDVQIY